MPKKSDKTFGDTINDSNRANDYNLPTGSGLAKNGPVKECTPRSGPLSKASK